MAATVSCIMEVYVTTANGEAGEASSLVLSSLLGQAVSDGSITREYKACNRVWHPWLLGIPTLVLGKKENTIWSMHAVTPHTASQGRK